MPELFEASPALLRVCCGALGLVVGSFLNVVIYRLPIMLERGWRSECRSFLGLDAEADAEPFFNLLWPHSFCPHCRNAVRPWNNIPVLSYLMLRGRCADCSAAISVRYPLIEGLTALLSVAVAARFGFSASLALGLLLAWILIALSVIDLDRYLLPDSITIPGLWIGLLASLGGWLSDPESSILGASAGYAVLWGVFQLFKLATGKEGMGYGDFKLLAMLGAWLGWQAIPSIVLLSSSVGALVGLVLILGAGHDKTKPIPFGPYLAVAGWIYLICGQAINAAYLGWFDGIN